MHILLGGGSLELPVNRQSSRKQAMDYCSTVCVFIAALVREPARRFEVQYRTGHITQQIYVICVLSCFIRVLIRFDMCYMRFDVFYMRLGVF